VGSARTGAVRYCSQSGARAGHRLQRKQRILIIPASRSGLVTQNMVTHRTQSLADIAKQCSYLVAQEKRAHIEHCR